MRILSALLGAALGRRLPITEGTLRIDGPRGPITIRRDAHGIPYIEAESDDDAFFGMGFSQAQDRAFQLELYLRVGRGTLAEVLGADMVPVDRLMRRLGLAEVARGQLAALAPREQAQLASFAAGINAAYAHGAEKKAHELVLIGIPPSRFQPEDTLVVLQFLAFALSSNWDAELARLRVLRQDGKDALLALEASDPAWGGAMTSLELLAADVDALAAAERLADDASRVVSVTGVRGASNAWAIGPSRTASGRPLMACDPHLSAALPAPWYLTHVRTPTWSMSGACLPSQPAVSFGHNGHVAWGITAGHVDNTDLFLERVGEDGKSVLDGDRWVPCEVRRETIAIKGKPSVTERVLVTPRGPIVSPPLGGSDVALSMRATWMAARRIGGYEVRHAKSVAEALAVYSSYPALSEHRVFADRHGTIARQVIGDAPVRRGGTGMVPVPGWDKQFGWEDEPQPYAALPTVTDPTEGFAAVANAYPGPSPTGAFLGADWLDGSRLARITERLASREGWDFAATMELQVDRHTVLWPRLRDVVIAAARRAGENDAVRLLSAWDGTVSGESAAASIYELFFADMMVRVVKAKAPNAWRAAIGEGVNAVLTHGMMSLRRLEHLVMLLLEAPPGWFQGGWDEECASAMGAAMQTLRARGSEVRWRWGDVRPLVLEHAMGTQRPFDRIWNRGPYAFGGDATTIVQGSVVFDDPLSNAIGIPNLRMVLDVGQWENNRFVLAGGQSGNPMSPHYDDMIDLWLRGEAVTMAWTDEAIRAKATATLVLEPK